MNEKIKAHVAKYNESEGWETTDESIVETIREAGKKVWSGNNSSSRWWDNVFTVVELDGMLIGFWDAENTGDNTPSEVGWEFDPSTICEVVAKEKTVTYYEAAP